MEERIIYGDVLFMIDLSMDLLALYGTVRLCGKPCRIRRIAIGAAVTAAFGVMSLLLPGNTVISTLLMLLTAGVGCLIALPDHKVGFGLYIKAVILFIFLEGAAGGILTGFYYSLNQIFSAEGIHLASGDRRLQLFWLFCGLLALFFSVVVSVLRSARQKTGGGTVSVTYRGRTAVFEGIRDTGNLVRESISGLPVIFVPSEGQNLLGISDQMLKSGQLPRTRPISVSGVTGCRILWAVHPEKLSVSGTCADAYVAFYDAEATTAHQRSITGANGVPPAIIPADML